VKFKLERQQQFVIGGYLDGSAAVCAVNEPCRAARSRL
jgi:hypothetical protein